MHFNRLKPVLAGFFMLFSLVVFSQNDITSGGGTLSDGSFILSYSLGQVSYQTVESPQAHLSQGVQQSFELVEISAANPASPDMRLRVFPNPTSDQLKIEVSASEILDVEANVFDASGRCVFSRILHSETSIIPFTQLSAGIYFLELHRNSELLRSFKIIRN